MKQLLYRWAKTRSVRWMNAVLLTSTTAFIALPGLLYWWVAARFCSAQAVGWSSAALSTMQLLAMVSLPGVGTLLPAALLRRPQKAGAIVGVALIIAGATGGCIGMVFALIVPSLSAAFQTMREGVADSALFAAGVSLAAIGCMLDQALIGLLQDRWQFWHRMVFALAKLVALLAASFWLSRVTGLTIYVTWGAGSLLSLALPGGVAVVKRRVAGRSARPEWGWLRKLKPTVVLEHLLAVAIQAPVLALPLLVTVTLSVIVNAWFYIAWTVAGFLFVELMALGMAFYAALYGEANALVQKIWLVTGFALLATLVTAGIVLLYADQILAFFGHAYAQQGASSLLILSLGCFPVAIKQRYLAVYRSRKQGILALTPLLIGGVLELAMAALGAYSGGLARLCLYWVATAWLESLYVLYMLYKSGARKVVSYERSS